MTQPAIYCWFNWLSLPSNVDPMPRQRACKSHFWRAGIPQMGIHMTWFRAKKTDTTENLEFSSTKHSRILLQYNRCWSISGIFFGCNLGPLLNHSWWSSPPHGEALCCQGCQRLVRPARQSRCWGVGRSQVLCHIWKILGIVGRMWSDHG